MQRVLVSGCGLLCLVFCAMVLVGKNDEQSRPDEKVSGRDSKSKLPNTNFAPDSLAYRFQQARKSRLKIREALQKTVSKKFENATLGQAVAFLTKESKVKYHWNSPELSSLNIDSSTPIHNTELRDVSLEIAIGRILEPLDMGWYIEDNVVVLTSEDEAKEALFTRVYDVEAFLAKPFDGETGAGSPVAAPQADSTQNLKNDPARISNLIEEESRGPWEELDQEGGTLSFYAPNLLAINQTRKVHDEIGELLKILKDGLDGKLNNKSQINRHRRYPYEKDRKIYRAFNHQVDLNFKDNTLGDLVDFLHKSYNLDVFLDRKELDGLNISKDTPIQNFKMKQIALVSALELILKPLELEALVEEGSLEITSLDKAKETLFNVVYDVRDLQPQNLQPSDSSTIIDVLMNETSGPWQYIDQEGGTVSILKGLLVIRQTAKMHAEIEMLLKELRKKRKTIPVQEKKKIDLNQLTTEVYTVDASDDPEKVKQALELALDDASWNHDASKNRIIVISQKLVIRASYRLQQKVENFMEKFQVPKRNEFSPGSNRGGGFGGQGGGPGGQFSLVPTAPVVSKKSSRKNLKLPSRR